MVTNNLYHYTNLSRDHLVSKDEELNVGVMGDANALTIKDIHSGLKAFCPSATKDANSTAIAIKHNEAWKINDGVLSTDQ